VRLPECPGVLPATELLGDTQVRIPRPAVRPPAPWRPLDNVSGEPADGCLAVLRTPSPATR